jgi:hypothetical protein
VEKSQAKRVVELKKGDTRILVTVLEGNEVASCVEEENKKYCETCQCDDETCQEWINHLESQGYQATEIELGELGLEESLPRFLEQREPVAAPAAAPAVETEAVPPAETEVQPPAEPEVKPEEEGESAVSGTDQALS